MSQPSALLARFPMLSRPAQWPRTVQLGVAAAIIALFAVTALWTRNTDYKVLFNNLSDRDGGAIVTALTQMNVPYTFGQDGNAILIPSDKVYETRLRLAEQGLPRSGDSGFELLDKTRFGASQFTEQVTYQRALEGELKHSVEALHAVESARVHLALPRETLFVRDRQPPTASVIVSLYPGRMLSENQIAAITWMVSSSVPHLTADRVSIVDQNGRLLTTNGQEGGVANHRSIILDIEQRATERILTLLTPLVGPGNVRAQVSADVDFAQREHTSETYGPNQTADRAAVRSKQTSLSTQGADMPAQGVPGALTNQAPLAPVAPLVTPDAGDTGGQGDEPAQGDPDAGNDAGPQDSQGAAVLSGTPGIGNAQAATRNDATINYEVDRTIRHVKDSPGQIRRLSAAVVINHHQVDGESRPLAPEEIAQFESLIKQAMGFDAQRGDSVSIVNSVFNEAREPSLPVWENPLYQAFALQLARYLVLLLLAWLVWRKVLKPMVNSQGERIVAAPATPPEVQDEINRAADAKRRASEMSRYEDNLAAARTMAEQDPRAVAMVVRSWMEKDGNTR